MATCKMLLPVTLCFLLLVLAESQEDNNTIVVVFYGTARCKSNTSMTINDAPLQLVINNATIPGTGRTTSTGQIVMAVSLTSAQHLDALTSNDGSGGNKAFLVAPPQACGGAAIIPPGTVVAAEVHPADVLIIVDGGLHATDAGGAATNHNNGAGDTTVHAHMLTIAASGGLAISGDKVNWVQLSLFDKAYYTGK